MKNRKFWEKWECDILKEKYGKITNKEIQKILPHRSIDVIKNKARSLGLKGDRTLHTIKYLIDRNYFDSPNIENSYWAGYIAADGSLNSARNTIKLVCSAKDIEILENFNICTNSTYPIKIYKGRILYHDNKEYQCSDYAEIQISSSHNLRKNLLKYWNITDNKSLTLQPPNIINIKHNIAYICGYIDGDGGCFYCNQGTAGMTFNLHISGTYNLLEWIIKIIRELKPDLKFKGTISLNGNSKNNYKIVWSSNLAKEIHNTLKTYVNIPYKLKRKWDIDYEKS
jgi:hypothetical protein